MQDPVEFPPASPYQKRMMHPFILSAVPALMSLMTSACASTQIQDPHQWLEDIHAPESLEWVKVRNERATHRLEQDARFPIARAEAKKILAAKDRIINPSRQGDFIEEFYQDSDHVRGILRRSPVGAYRSGHPIWETLFDVDALGKQENESWVWHGKTCLPPDYERCLLMLSRGGKDAEVIREWNAKTRQFVPGGFYLPEAKTNLAWLDENTLLVGTDFGPGSMTDSGYPRLIKIWKRGTPLEKAEFLFEARQKDVWVYPVVAFRPEGKVALISRGRNFYESDLYWYKPDGTLAHLPTTEHFGLDGVLQGKVIGSLKRDVRILDKAFKAGSVVAFDLQKWAATLVYEPGPESGYASVSVNRNRLLITTLQNVRKQLYEARPLSEGGWTFNKLPLPEMGTISVVDADEWSDDAFALYQSFFEPTRLLDLQDKKVTPLKSLPARFDAAGMKAEQRWATSRDGTKVPYFLLTPKKTQGPLPTLLYGYGGFEVSQVPVYSGVIGKLWLEKGGAFVMANIRGGGEFGPRWHQAALLDNRQKAFDDFIAIAEDLIRAQITTPSQLAIQGGSNGGLLVGATFTQRPDLFRAVVCQVPLLDMLRYHLLLAGASWMAEYGNPDESRMRDVILRYSPYQNVKAEIQYPEVFLMTSTEDDRVHPGHARKMAARLEEFGHPHLYFENMEGGHGAAADLEQRARMQALAYTFLYQTLLDASKKQRP